MWARWDVAQELPYFGMCLAPRGWAELSFLLPVLISSNGRAGCGFLDNHTLLSCPVQHGESWALLGLHGWIMNTVLEMFRLSSCTPCKSLKALETLLLCYKNSPKNTLDDSPLKFLSCSALWRKISLHWADSISWHTHRLYSIPLVLAKWLQKMKSTGIFACCLWTATGWEDFQSLAVLSRDHWEYT